MILRISNYSLKYLLWMLLIIGLVLFTPIPIYLGKLFIEKKYDVEIGINQVTGGLLQGLNINKIKLQNISIENINTSPMLSLSKKIISFYGLRSSIPEHSDILVKEVKLQYYLLTSLKQFSIESSSTYINEKNYNLQVIKSKNHILAKLFSLEHFIELVIHKNSIKSTINIKDIHDFSRKGKGNLSVSFESIISSALPSLSLQLNSDKLKINNNFIHTLHGKIEDNNGKIIANTEYQGKKLSLELKLSKNSPNSNILTLQTQNNNKTEEVQLIIKTEDGSTLVLFDKSKKNQLPGFLKSVSDICLQLKYENETLKVNSAHPEAKNQINGYIRVPYIDGQIDATLNNIELSDQSLPIKKELFYSGKISLQSQINFNRTKSTTFKSKFNVKDFELQSGVSSKTNIFQAGYIDGSVKYDGKIAHISLEDRNTQKLKASLELKDGLRSLYGKAKIQINAAVLEAMPEIFPSAKGELNLAITAKGKLLEIKMQSQHASIINDIIERDIKHIELAGKIDLDSKYSINGKACTSGNELVFFNINSNNTTLTAKFSSNSISLTPNKDYKLTTKVQGAYQLSLIDRSSTLDILTDLQTAKISLEGNASNEQMEDVASDIIFIEDKNSNKPTSPPKSKDSKIFKLSAKEPVIFVDGSGFSAKIKGNLDVIQDNSGAYYANGLLIIDKGKYKNLGKIFIIKRGSILYLPNTPINNPIISIQLEQQTISAGEAHLSIWLYGPINKLKASFSHDQRFSFNEDTINSQASLIAAQMANASGKSIASQLQNSLKLDELSLESSSNSHDPSVENMVLSIGKRLSKKIYVKLKKDISSTDTNSHDAVALKYKLNKNFSLNLESSTQNNEVSLQFTREDR